MAISIRPALAGDLERISAFLIELSEAFSVGEFSPEGRSRFMAELAPDRLRARLTGDFRFYLAEDGTQIAGVAAVRGVSHLYYLFVGRTYQRLGLARRLWTRAKDDALRAGNRGRFTVNASNHAVGAYERLGFRRTESTRNADGVLYNPMEFVVDA